MKLKKLITSLMILALSIALLSGCSYPKVASLNEFKKTMETNGLTVSSIKKELDHSVKEDMKDVLVASKGGAYEIKFYKSNEKSGAYKIYDAVVSKIKNENVYFRTASVVSKGDYRCYETTIDNDNSTTWYLVKQIGDTVVCIDTDCANKEEITALLEQIGF